MKKNTLKEFAKMCMKSINEYLDTLPPKERRKRILAAYRAATKGKAGGRW